MTPRWLAPRVVAWFRRARRDLPWRRTQDPYAIWVSEIMAQQTRIATVIPYWERWMARFPDVAALAAAPLDDVLALWSGLGYYSRARSLHRAAQTVMTEHDGRVPSDDEGLRSLPGVGRYTAGAIRSIAFDLPAPIVDGNVARVFARVFGIDTDITAPATQARLWDLAEQAVRAAPPSELNQGLMELGALVCTPRSPDCGQCPLARRCVARETGRTGELPVKKAKAAVRAQEIELAWLSRAGRVLLARRKPEGLFGGLWELPAVESLTGVRVDREQVLATHRHQLTHRTIQYRVLPGRATRTLAWGAPYDEGRWVTVETADGMGVSSATRALLREVRAR